MVGSDLVFLRSERAAQRQGMPRTENRFQEPPAAGNHSRVARVLAGEIEAGISPGRHILKTVGLLTPVVEVSGRDQL